MKRIILGCLLALSVAAHAATLEATAPVALSPLPEHAQAARLGAQILERHHYRTVALDDALAGQIFERYLEALDPNRVFFAQADIDRLADARSRLDDAIVQGDLSLPFDIYNRYRERAVERLGYARELARGGFDFERRESYRFDRSEAAWAVDEPEARDLWRKRVKNDWLRLKLAGKGAKEIAAILDRRYANYLARTLRSTSDDVFQTFMDAYAMSIDPHTNYLGVRQSEDFDIAMRLSLVGVGIVLQERNEYITIREIVVGGPAERSGQLAVGDRIVGVAQGPEAAMTELVGWRMSDAVRLIRGAKGSTVVLDVLPAQASEDGAHKRVSLVRDRITLEQQAARKAVVELESGATKHRVGIITLPTFYADFAARARGDADYRSVTRDVARLLDELKADEADGVVIDLRDNGGGSLAEAIELTGLFIDRGPVVQQRNAEGKLHVNRDDDAGVAWDGPLAVLINRRSASASEIVAAAIQDYGRGLIVGEPSFGKGTIQNMIDLDREAGNDRSTLGKVKLTIAQFFRVNGGTTQLRGVTPDIPFPDDIGPDDDGEAGFDNALPWMQIQPVAYVRSVDVTGLRASLLQHHRARIARDRALRFVLEDLAEIRRERDRKVVSLNEGERRAERRAREARIAARGKTSALVQATFVAPLRDDGLQVGERSLEAELAAQKARREGTDPIAVETARIVLDAARMLRNASRLVGPDGTDRPEAVDTKVGVTAGEG